MQKVAFVGNDINDVECMRHIGLPICVAGAYPEVKAILDYIFPKQGGERAVREICDTIVSLLAR